LVKSELLLLLLLPSLIPPLLLLLPPLLLLLFLAAASSWSTGVKMRHELKSSSACTKLVWSPRSTSKMSRS
jgi:hypothetical protein